MTYLRAVTAGVALSLATPVTMAAVAVDDFYVTEQGSVFFFYPERNDQLDAGYGGFDSMTFELVQGEGTVQVNSDGPSFQAAQGFIGEAEIAYTIEDSAGTDSASVFIEVQEATTGIQAINDNFYLAESGGTVTYDVTANDQLNANSDFPASISQVSATTAEGGRATVSPNNAFSIDYTPPQGFTGTDTFTYTLSNEFGDSSQTTVTVYVGVEPGQTNEITMPGNLTPEEARTFAVAVEACALDDDESLPCGAIAELTDEEKKQLAQQLSGRHAKLQARAMRQLQRNQSSNILARLKEIRSGGSRVSVAGLNAAIMGEPVPLGQALQGALNNTLRGGSAGDGELKSPWGAFVSGKITAGDSDENGTRPGYDQDGYDLTLGLDYRLNDKAVLGAAAGLGESDTDFTSVQGSQKAQSYSLALFGNYYPSANVYIDALAMWSEGDLDVERRIDVANIQQNLSSDTTSQQLTAATSVGYELNRERWQSAFYGRLEYSDLSIDGYRESGGSFALDVAEQNTDTLIAAVGTRVGYTFSWSRGVIVPGLELEYISESDSDYNIANRFADAVPAGQFTLNGEEPDTDYMSASLSASAVFSAGRSAYLRYETLLLQDSYDYSSLSLGFRMEF